MFDDRAKAHYQGAAGHAYHQHKRGIPAQAFSWIARLRSSKFQPHVTTKDVVFEYGVGSGWNLASLQCARRLGSDVSDFLESSLREAGIEFVADPQRLPEASIDVVICHHALEHVLNPPAVLDAIRRLLRPGGRLLLNVPFEKERRYRRFDPAEPNHHLYSWNMQTLGNLVTETGFEVLDARLGEFGYDRFAAVWAARLRLGEFGFRATRKSMHLVKPGRELRFVLSPR